VSDITHGDVYRLSADGTAWQPAYVVVRMDEVTYYESREVWLKESSWRAHSRRTANLLMAVEPWQFAGYTPHLFIVHTTHASKVRRQMRQTRT
jgi:hypothetical protein